ncbi:MAG: hypothetical protein ACLRXH_05125 [Monoglobus pectinilyticus]
MENKSNKVLVEMESGDSFVIELYPELRQKLLKILKHLYQKSFITV